MSVGKRRLKYLRKDEKMATEEYAKYATKSDNSNIRRMFKEMSRDEKKHDGYLKEILKLEEKQKKRKGNISPIKCKVKKC